MDLINAIENIQNSTYDFALKYLIEPNSEKEHYDFINFCKERGITLVSGKSYSTIPYVDSRKHDKVKFMIVKLTKGIHLTYENSRNISTRKLIFVKDFFEICKIEGL